MSVLFTRRGIAPNIAKVFEFFLDIVYYQAEEGMTWAEWCDSKYNVDGWYVSDNMIYDSYGECYVMRKTKLIKPSDIIDNNSDYTVGI